MAVANGWSLGRDVLRHGWEGRVIVADRYHLDSIVRMRFLYDEHREFRLQRLIVAALSPARATPSYSTSTPPPRWLARTMGGVRRSSPSRLGYTARSTARTRPCGSTARDPPAELCGEIAERVWRGLR